MRFSKTITSLLGVLLLSLFSRTSFADCPQWVAEIMSIQGTVQTQVSPESDWLPAQPQHIICPGETLRVLKLSRSMLRLRNNNLLNLDQNTTLTLASGETGTPQWLMKLLSGTVFFRGRQHQALEIETPFINAVHEGTEFSVQVSADQATIAVWDGQVKAVNKAGQLQIKQGFAGIAGRTSTPRLQAITITPQDAVQWSLFYAAIVDKPPTTTSAQNAIVQKAWTVYQQGNVAAALSVLDSLPTTAQDAAALSLKAALLLSVGRVDAAQPLLQQALQGSGDKSAAYAIQAIIAVTKNQTQTALSLAKQAVQAAPQSAVAALALSYAQQAQFDIAAALAAAQQATTIAPDNALAWARVAELQLAQGEQGLALQAAEQAQRLKPQLARTQSILGFAALADTDLAKAQQAFQQAVRLDTADPLPRLGLGLTYIRSGESSDGIRELETAVNLAPDSAIARSYLGKAYAAQNNTAYAAKELELAKAMDAKDPTPWFYDALLKQTTNRPGAALADMQQAIRLNDQRAVYRSRLLLDEDRAVRGASLGRIYNELGFNDVVRQQATGSLDTDPTNYTSHRLLSDSYRFQPRQEIARASDVLQAQLLQPLNYNPIQPQLAYTDLNIPKAAGFADTSFNEYSRVLDGNQQRFTATGLYGSNDTPC